jgi:hypothetical protein
MNKWGTVPIFVRRKWDCPLRKSHVAYFHRHINPRGGGVRFLLVKKRTPCHNTDRWQLDAKPHPGPARHRWIIC